MANCHDLFLAFNSVIELTDNRKQSLRKSRNALRDRIRNYFQEKQNGFAPKFHGQGSFMMNTIINPLDGEYDIDDGIYFEVERKPEQAITTFHRWICKAVDGHTKDKPVDKNTCIRVIYKGNYHIDLPIYYIVKGNNCPYLAHKDSGWIASDPREFIRWFESHTDAKGQLRRIVRYLKAWSDYKSADLPSGLIFTILATENIQHDDRDDIALYKTLDKIKSHLDFSFTCCRPTTPKGENLLREYNPLEQFNLMSQLTRIIKSAKVALDSRTSRKDACKEWQRHFGGRFPCHIVEDKDDELLSAAYSASLTFANRAIIPSKPKGFA